MTEPKINLDKLQYPNPQMIRENWIDLNGIWYFAFDDENKGLLDSAFTEAKFYDKKINVPYSYTTRASGIYDRTCHDIVWYCRPVSLDVKSDKRYILHFEAVDYQADIFWNGKQIYTHLGGHIPFEIDVTSYAKAENTLVVRAEDHNRTSQPCGKQSWKAENFTCWYTRTVGIWQPVWIEEVGTAYIKDIRITPDIDDASIEIDAVIDGAEGQKGTSDNLISCTNVSAVNLTGEIRFEGQLINTFSFGVKSNRAKGRIDVSDESPDFRLRFWSPIAPNLYDITLRLEDKNVILDQVESYFGMRDISTRENKILLNNQEFYQKLILDQGYFYDGGLTATAEELKEDVIKIKEMGFNGARKHQKIENHRYMYLMDSVGLVMWAEMPSFYEYSHISNENAVRELYGLISKHYNHPSVITYTLMNESWGINEVYKNKKEQNFVDALYHLTKSLDSTRLVIGNDGWEQCCTDILSYHDYNSDTQTLLERYADAEKIASKAPSPISRRYTCAQGYDNSGKPFILSEFGGIAYDCGTAGKFNTWGYGIRMTDKEEIFNKIKAIFEAALAQEHSCGFCYTQLSDVEQEINGLLDHKHTYKFDPERIREILGDDGGFIFD